MTDQHEAPTSEEASRDTPMPPRRRWPWLVAAAILLPLVVFIAWPSPVDPVAWDPPPPTPLEGPYAPNEALRKTKVLGEGLVPGPEDVDVDARGRIYGACADGRIVRLSGEAHTRAETFATTGGRPLGLDFDADGNLLVADAWKGLLRVSPAGKVETLSTEAGGVPYAFTNDVVVAKDGRVYFTDASSKYHQPDYLLDLLEARPNGRLLRWDPGMGETEVLADDLYFANGVALSQDERFLLVNETYRFRIRRYWIAGDKAGTIELFADALPGYADGISSDGAGTFYVAFFAVRNPTADSLAPRRFLKSLLAKLPRFLWPKPEPYGFIAALDETGTPVASWHDPGGKVMRTITSVEPHEGILYLGSLHEPRIGAFPPGN
jgi:sugar lactone lactonase YvrE